MNSEFYKNLLNMSFHAMEGPIKGGAIIAIASTLYYLLFGGILGMSGMAGSIIKYPARHATKLKAIVLLGILFASALIHFFHNRFTEFKGTMHLPFDNKSSVDSTSVTHLAVAGFLVGLGTELANGCTSGHGLCGLPRFSLRSFVAVLVFLSTAVATATLSLKSNIPDLPQLNMPVLDKLSVAPEYYLAFCAAVALLLMITQKQKSFISKVTLFVIGVVFGCGLMVAGMSQRSKIYGFLQLDSNWDPSLLLVLMTGVLINVVTFNLIIKFVKKPSYGDKVQNPHGKVTMRLILGSLLFGLGWGIGGLCPGPFVLSIPNSIKVAVAWGAPFFLAQTLSGLLFSEKQAHHPEAVKQKEEATKQKSS